MTAGRALAHGDRAAPRRSWARRGLVAVALSLGSGSMGACGAEFEEAPSCADSVDACAPNETCWPDARADTFECRPSPVVGGDVRDACEINTNRAQCAHGLFCYPPLGGSDGICSPRCDPEGTSSVCPGGVCRRLTVGGVGVIGVCQI